MAHRCALEVSVSAFYDPKLDWQPGPGPRRLAARQERMRVEADAVLDLPEGVPARILHEVYAPDGKKASEMDEDVENSTDSRKLFVPEPLWWSPEAPRRYTLVSTLLCGENSCVCSRSFGLRVVSWHPAWGFLFNGEPLSIRGVCAEDALNALQAREEILPLLEKLRAEGVNMLRVPAPGEVLLECCDEAGLLVEAVLLCPEESASLPASESEVLAAKRLQAVNGHPCVVMLRAAGKNGAWFAEITRKYAPKLNAVWGPDVPLSEENGCFSLQEASGSFSVN